MPPGPSSAPLRQWQLLRSLPYSPRRFPRPIFDSCPTAKRRYALQSPGTPSIQVFSPHTKWMHRERAATDVEESRKVDYVREEVASRLCDRLLDINRRFDEVLDFGAGPCTIAKILTEPLRGYEDAPADQQAIIQSQKPLASRIGHLTSADTSKSMLYRDASLPFNEQISLTRDLLENGEYLPYGPNTFDLCLSALSLHWLNDLPAVLSQINTCLKPDAPFIAAMAGGDTLFELRGSLQLAEQDRVGGVGRHVSPLADVRDVGNLLSRAGFKLLTVDVDDIVVDYPSVFALMSDLQSMGESNAALAMHPSLAGLTRDVLLATEGVYRELYGNEDGSLPATFRTIYMIGWKESEGQPEPLKRGSGQINMKDILEGGGGPR
ncbi:hypothetical protein LTR28_005001 [Elasticomyces elasticus]|nr:hypothetical protein LTR28_005001 [Elasticomyces elasticus]